jgi:hypothetical protein
MDDAKESKLKLFQSDDVDVPPPTDDQSDCATVVADVDVSAVSPSGVSFPGSDVSADIAPFRDGVRR